MAPPVRDSVGDVASEPLRTVSPGRPTHPSRTPLAALAAELRGRGVDVRLEGDDTVEVTGVSLSTQRLQPGDLYAALPGASAHGADFGGVAVDAGAIAVLTDPTGLDRLIAAGVRLPALVVSSPRAVLGGVSAQVYGRPAERLRMIGVTGTQGKTTTTRLLEGALERAGIPSAVIGTIGTRIAGADVATALTTPEAPDLHGLFALMLEQGVEVCAMEVSSHALVLGRVDGVVFDIAVFTNLGRDHLDFHTDVEDYYRAKATLFSPERSRAGLVCVDDEFGRRLAQEAGVPVSTYAVRGPADWRAEEVVAEPAASHFVAAGPDGVRLPTTCPLPGFFNVANALAAVAAATAAGIDPALVAAGLGTGGGVPGRLEPVEAGQDFTVVVDYAHKPDAVEAAIAALRPLTAGQVIVVIGAGGDRDHGKRPLMGAIAARDADVLIVTDDNPRTEDPGAIRAAVLGGAEGIAGARIEEVGDRRSAVRRAIGLAAPGDVVLIAGKGHESGQEIDGVVHPFDDREVAREEIAERLAGRSGRGA